MSRQNFFNTQLKNVSSLCLLSGILFLGTLPLQTQIPRLKHPSLSQPSAYSHPIPNEFPDEISFCVADLKFDGTSIKICEFGEGLESRFKGYQALYENNSVWSMLWSYLKSFNLPVWFTGKSSHDYDIKSLLATKGKLAANLSSIEADEDFKQALKKYKMRNNHAKPSGIVVARSLQIHTSVITNFKAKYPGMIILGQATNKFVRSKYHTNKLFESRKLASYKPKFKIYEKRYSTTLANNIIEELGCQTFVIKPIDAALGNGIIMVQKNELDTTLRLILKNPQELELFKKDMSYYYWKKDQKEFFIVEEYAPSKTIYINEKPYDPTMRVIFTLNNLDGNIVITYFDAYWKLPTKSLTQEGSLTEKHKSHIGPDNNLSSAPVDYKDFETVKALLSKALPEFYLKMLKNSFPLQ